MLLQKVEELLHFSHSSHAYSKLKTIQNQLNIPNHKLIQDVTTRWNSTYYMLSRFYEQRQAISTYAVDNEISTLTSTQWSLVGNIVYVLKPFEEITKLASADKECISYVTPAVTILMTYLSKRNQELDSNCHKIYKDLAIYIHVCLNNVSAS